MAKIKHISGKEFDETETVITERIDICDLGIRIPEEKIKAEFKKIPWWKRWLMFSKQKELERAKITLRFVNGDAKVKYYTGGIKIKWSWWHRIHMWWLWKRSRKAWEKYFKATSEKEFDKNIKKIVTKFIENEK